MTPIIEFIPSLPMWIGCAIAMVSTTLLGLVVYVIFYKFNEKYKKVELKDPITSLFRMVGILVSLMLSLAFGEVITEWQAIKNAINQESVAISDTLRTQFLKKTCHIYINASDFVDSYSLFKL